MILYEFQTTKLWNSATKNNW